MGASYPDFDRTDPAMNADPRGSYLMRLVNSLLLEMLALL